jgi:hypothetical protein
MENKLVLSHPRNDSEIIATIQRNPFYINKVEKTPERCLTAVRQNGLLLGLIPKELHTEALCLEAVKQNPTAIKMVSKRVLNRILNEDICFEAVSADGAMINYIPNVFKTSALYLEAIKQNSRCLKLVPDKYKSESFYTAAISLNGLALEFVPENFMSKELYAIAIEKNGLALEFVPDKERSENLCLSAVKNNVLALEYVPQKYKNKELCNAAIASNWKTFLYVPQNMYTYKNCLGILERILTENEHIPQMSHRDSFYYWKDRHNIMAEIIGRFPDKINNDVKIIKLERQLQARAFIKKHFDKETSKFITIEEICYRNDDEIIEFDSFVDFYKHLDGNLKDADLYDCDFKGVNLADFNIDGAYLNSSVLVEQGLYDDSFYNAHVKDGKAYTELIFSAENEVVEAISVLHDTDLFADVVLNDTSYKMYYVSDIHLNHKLLKAFPLYATEMEIGIYIRYCSH